MQSIWLICTGSCVCVCCAVFCPLLWLIIYLMIFWFFPCFTTFFPFKDFFLFFIYFSFIRSTLMGFCNQFTNQRDTNSRCSCAKLIQSFVGILFQSTLYRHLLPSFNKDLLSELSLIFSPFVYFRVEMVWRVPFHRDLRAAKISERLKVDTWMHAFFLF